VTLHSTLRTITTAALSLFTVIASAQSAAQTQAQTPPAAVAPAATAPAAAAPAAPPAEKVATLTRIRQNGFVTIAHRESSVPFSYVNEQTKEPIGFTVDICKKIVEAVRQELKLGKLDIKYVMVKPADRLSTIKAGKADLECGNTTNNPDRRKDVNFAIPHYIDGARLMSKGGAMRDLSSVAGRKVVTIEKGTSEKMITEHNRRFSTRIEILTTKDHKESFERLDKGEADVWMIDGIILASARAQAAKPSDFFISQKLLTIEPLAIMYAKDDDAFGAVVDREIRRLMRGNEFQNIYRKWFQSPVPPKNINLDVQMNSLLKAFIESPTAEMPQNF
jgi:ABC-type amino acid transport substrate-binding protein